MSMEHNEQIKQPYHELEIPTPRKLRLKSFGEARGLWMRRLLVLIFSFLAVLYFSYRIYVPFLASEYGISSQATIINLWQTYGRSTTNHVRVEYLVNDRSIAGSIQVSGTTYRQLSIGMKVQIHYLPLFPEEPSVDIDTDREMVIVYSGFFIFLVGMQLFSLFKERYFLVNGKAVTGSVSVENNRTRYVDYYFQGKAHVIQMEGRNMWT